tara:strand:- start:270 stop:965 length:696 start_codon:yes stop_codon:yes gene_type:complete
MQVKYSEQFKVHYRPGTSDEKCLKEIFVNRAYSRKFAPICPGEVWLDIGANIGLFVAYASNLGAIVKAYEPDPANLELLALNTPNDGQNDVFPYALDIQEGELSFYSGENTGNYWRGSLYHKIRGAKKIQVQVKNIEEELKKHKPTGVKLDCEGSEIGILSSVNFAKYGVKKIIAEWSFDINPYVQVLFDAIAFLESQGYEVKDTRNVKKSCKGDKWEWNPPQTFLMAVLK